MRADPLLIMPASPEQEAREDFRRSVDNWITMLNTAHAEGGIDWTSPMLLGGIERAAVVLPEN